MVTTGIMFGGPSNEHEISILTGLQCERALAEANVQTVPLYWAMDGNWYQVPNGTEAKDYLKGAPEGATQLELTVGGATPGWSRKGMLKRAHVEIGRVLNCFHGGAGESGGIQWILRLNNIPVTGPTPASATLSMDKLAFGTVVESAGLPSLPRALVSERDPGFKGPYIVKPRFGGSSIGIEVVPDIETARELVKVGVHYREGAIVEPYRKDLYDLNIAYTSSPQFRYSMIEKPVRSEGTEIYGYAEKYLAGAGLENSSRELPAQIPQKLEDKIHEYVHAVYEATGINGIVRVDFLSDGKDLYVNELNAPPGAMALYLWGPDQELAELLTAQLEEAERLAKNVVPVSITGTALQSAGGISAKLAGYRQQGTTPAAG